MCTLQLCEIDTTTRGHPSALAAVRTCLSERSCSQQILRSLPVTATGGLRHALRGAVVYSYTCIASPHNGPPVDSNVNSEVEVSFDSVRLVRDSVALSHVVVDLHYREVKHALNSYSASSLPTCEHASVPMVCRKSRQAQGCA
jgi:hypothetical protein